MGTMMPAAPMSRTGLINTGSFHATRTNGAVSVAFVAIICACTASRDNALCSMSIHTKSNTVHKASVAVGSKKLIPVPRQTLPERILFVSFIALSISALRFSRWRYPADSQGNEIHRMLGFEGQGRAPIFHLGDLGTRDRLDSPTFHSTPSSRACGQASRTALASACESHHCLSPIVTLPRIAPILVVLH